MALIIIIAWKQRSRGLALTGTCSRTPYRTYLVYRDKFTCKLAGFMDGAGGRMRESAMRSDAQLYLIRITFMGETLNDRTKLITPRPFARSHVLSTQCNTRVEQRRERKVTVAIIIIIINIDHRASRTVSSSENREYEIVLEVGDGADGSEPSVRVSI